MSAADGTPRLGWLRSTARNANSHTTLIVRPKPLALRLMPRRSASACGRAWSRRTSAASGSCWNCSSTASSSPTKLLRSVTQSLLDRRASASRFVYCEQTINMDAALNCLRPEGYGVRDEDVPRLSPLGFEHINMLGRYAFVLPDAVA